MLYICITCLFHLPYLNLLAMTVVLYRQSAWYCNGGKHRSLLPVLQYLNCFLKKGWCREVSVLSEDNLLLG